MLKGTHRKRWMSRVNTLAVCAAVSACTIGNGMICGPQTPIAYCDREAYQRLAHPKPYIENWEKPEADSAVRSKDAVSCNSGFRFVPQFIAQEQVKAAQRADETENDTYHRLMFDWQRCMINKGYRYTGFCSVEYAKVAPACGAP